MKKIVVAEIGSPEGMAARTLLTDEETAEAPRKNKILVAAGIFPPGSVAEVVLDTIRAMPDYHFLVWVRRREKEAAMETLRRCLGELGEQWPENFNFFTSPSRVEAFADEIAASFFHLPTDEDWFMRFSLVRRIPAVVFSHSVSYFEEYPFVSSPSAPKVVWQRRAFLLANKIVCWSNLEKEMISRFLPIVGDRIEVVPLYQRISDDAPTHRPPPQGRRLKILFAGRPLAKRKGFEYLAMALQKLAEKKYRIALTVADAFTDTTELAKLKFSDRLGEIETTWLCNLRWERMRQLYQSSHVVVIPSLYDSWCKVLTEAIAEGAPVIATEATGATEFFSPDEVPRVKAGDADAIAEALEHLIADYPRFLAASENAQDRLRQELTPKRYAKSLSGATGLA